MSNASTLLQSLNERLYNVQLEKAIISHCINIQADQIEILTNLEPKHFADQDNDKLYTILLEMFQHRMNISLESILSVIPLKVTPGLVESVKAHLLSVALIPHKDTVFNSIFFIKELYRNRVIHTEVLVKVNMMFTNNTPIKDIIEHIAKSLISVEIGKKEVATKNVVNNVVDSILNPIEGGGGLKIGLDEFDVTYGGVKKDTYITIGAESGAGKTADVIDLIDRLCIRYSEKVAILFFSLEMSESRIVKRLVSRKTGMTVEKLEQNLKTLSKDEKALVQAAGEEIKKYPLQIIYDTITTTMMELKMRKFAMENPDKHLIVVLDWIGLVKGATNDMRVNTILTSTTCKGFCRDYDATTIVLTQFTKEVESREAAKEYNKPKMGYIMESGRIRQDSDIVMLLWRPETRYATIPFAGNPEWDTKNKLIVLNEKNRDGQAPTDMIFNHKIAVNQILNTTEIFS